MTFMLQRMPWEAEHIAFTHEEATGQPQREGNQHNKDQNSSNFIYSTT